MDLELFVNLCIGLAALIVIGGSLFRGKFTQKTTQEFFENWDEEDELDPNNPLSPVYHAKKDVPG